MHDQTGTTTLPAGFAPDAVPTASVAPLAYAAPFTQVRVGESRFGYASCAAAGLTVLFSVACVVGMTQAKGWDVLGWFIVGMIGNWVGAGGGLLLGLIGVVQSRRGRRWSIHGMWIDGTIAAIPLILLALIG